MQLLMNLHIHRYLRHYPPSSPGHLYQGRYKNSLIESSASLYRVIQYVEANAQSAGLVRRAEDYKWSSASRHASEFGRPTISEWPLPKPPNWLELIAQPLSVRDLQCIQKSAKCGGPYGSERWMKTVVTAYQLEHTQRARGRPRVYEQEVPEREQTSQT
jgi:putative transposase